MQRRERDQLVAVDDIAGAIDRQHAIGIAVVGEADVVTAILDDRAQRFDVRRADAVVDVAPVRRDADRGDVRPEAPEDLGRRTVGGAVGAVERDVEARQIERGETGVQLAQVVVERAVQRAHVADVAIGGRRVGERRSISRSLSSESLSPSAPKNLMPLSA